MMTPGPLSDTDLAILFPAKRDKPIKSGAFELGLVLGGTVSAGAYTGGVLDYFLEALDAWQKAKEVGDPEAPLHEVTISTVAGTSGGAINGAILLRSAGWQFHHGESDTNPFYSSWTRGVDLMKLLEANPIENGLDSIFNCASIDEQAEKTIAYKGQPLGSGASPRHRSYLADPLRLIMMVGNVTGLPYSISMGGQADLAHDLIAHADFMRFALAVEKGIPNAPASRPDEMALSSTSEVNWDVLRQAALATSAFPVAFRSRGLSRAVEICGYRAVAIPAENGSAKVVQLIPNWDLLSRGEKNPLVTNFVTVDGGTINNEPVDLVRTALAGLDGRNKRKPGEADRAVILVDPFSDPENLGPRTPPGLVEAILPFVMSLVYQARFKPADIALAHDETVYSRYLVAPVGPGPSGKRTVGKDAIASGGLGGFLGFVDAGFLRYDYALGRANAHAFLTKHLAIPEKANNPIFNSWSDDQKRIYRFTDDGIDYLPLIPLMAPLRSNPPSLRPWPRLRAMPEGLSDAIAARADAVFALARRRGAPESWWKRALMSSYIWLGWKGYLRGALRNGALKVVHDGLIRQQLL